jgi:hypothetical protein
MRIRPFGLHKKTVNAFMKRIKNSQEQDLARLSGEITSAALRRDKLELMLQDVNQEQLVEELKDKLREELKTELRNELTTKIRAELQTELRVEVQEELRKELQEAADQSAETDQAEQAPPFSKTGKVLHFKQGGGKLRIVPRAQQEPLSDSGSMPIIQPQTSYVSQSLSSSIPPLPRKEQVKAVGMGFWENADDYLEPEEYKEGQQLFTPNAYTNTNTAPQGSVAFFEAIPPAMEEVAAAMEAPPAASKQPRGVTAPAPAAGTSKQSPAITEEIRMIRQKYIVGKIAGEDVYDSSGKLIIAKQSVITGEVVDKADTEGKLAELIVNMIIPGLGED